MRRVTVRGGPPGAAKNNRADTGCRGRHGSGSRRPLRLLERVAPAGQGSKWPDPASGPVPPHALPPMRPLGHTGPQEVIHSRVPGSRGHIPGSPGAAWHGGLG